MERAALALAELVAQMLGSEGEPVVILCGPGNNGGDGVALGRILHLRGHDVRVHLVTSRRGDSVDEQVAAAAHFGLRVQEGLPGAQEGAAVYVDALLGTGSKGAPRGSIADAITWLSGRSPIVAVDLPSGMDAKTGALHDPHVRATRTLSFERSKPGLHLSPGKDCRGQLRIARIGLRRAETDGNLPVLIDPAQVDQQLEALPVARHKGERGHVVVLGGSVGCEGAAVLSAGAALRSGAGLVTLFGPSSELASEALSTRPELMLGDWSGGGWKSRGDVLVVGPGLVVAEDLTRVASLWHDDARPAVWDASALSLELEAQDSAGVRVLTPHPKEAAALLTRLGDASWDVARVQSDRLVAAGRLSELSGACVVLKGAGSVVCEGLRTAINTSGDHRLATAGSGDVLAGLIAALLARGMASFDAACAGTYLHGLAGETLPSVGSSALDLVEALPGCLANAGLRPADWPDFVEA
jgi:NAD(P)H-hydrate epimerase